MSDKNNNLALIAVTESLEKVAIGELRTFKTTGVSNFESADREDTLTLALGGVSQGRRLESVEIDIHESGDADLKLGYKKVGE